MHVHHYCQGLNHMNRAKFSYEKQRRREYLQTATSEFDYVLRNWPDGFALKADAKAQKAQAEMLLRQP